MEVVFIFGGFGIVEGVGVNVNFVFFKSCDIREGFYLVINVLEI